MKYLTSSIHKNLAPTKHVQGIPACLVQQKSDHILQYALLSWKLNVLYAQALK